MNNLFVQDKVIKVKSGKLCRILVVFPHSTVANHALAWCRKHKLCVVDAALALLHQCDKKKAPTFGSTFGNRWGNLAGFKPRKVELEHLTK